MARGDVKWFAAFDKSAKGGVAFNLGADTLKLGIVTNSTVPGVGTTDPRWGSAGTTNFSSNEVALATGYIGPITLTNVTWTRTAGVVKLDFDDIVIAQDAAGFANGYWGIVYDDTVTGKYAVAFIDLGGPVSLVDGALNININVGGLATDTAA